MEINKRREITLALQKAFWEKSCDCMAMSWKELHEDKFCDMGMYQFIVEKFLTISDKELKGIVNRFKKSVKKQKNQFGAR